MPGEEGQAVAEEMLRRRRTRRLLPLGHADADRIEPILQRAVEKGADAILVSQVVTQRDVHKDNARQLVDLVKDKGLRDRFLLLLGGPRIDHKLALELGFDAGFGPGTKPSDVANFLFGAVLARKESA